MAKTAPQTVKLSPDLSSQELDQITLSKSQFTKGFIRFILCTAVAIFVFFTNLTIGGESQIVFGWIYNFFVDLLGNAGYWILTIIIGGNFLLHVYSRYIDKGKKSKKLYEHYRKEGIAQTFLYGLGTVYTVIYTLHTTTSFVGPEIIVGAATGESVFPPIVLGVLFIILVGALFMPFLLNYGAIEFVGALLEPLMRPLFKLPGKAALDATASFVSSSSLAVIITSRLYRQKVYTKREAVAVATCFSAVSIGFAYLVISTAGVAQHFTAIYLISFITAFIISAIVVRIPPISRKPDVYYDETPQTEEERKADAHFDKDILRRGGSRAVKRAFVANPVSKDIAISLKEGLQVIPQVLTMLAAIGVSAMSLAEYTPLFQWIGLVFQPLLQILQVPDAAAIAPSIPVGIAEMFLPVLLISEKAATLSESARCFLCIVSMVQIIFFSETGTVILATKLPVKLHELIICFIERTLIAIPLAALAMHLFF